MTEFQRSRRGRTGLRAGPAAADGVFRSRRPISLRLSARPLFGAGAWTTSRPIPIQRPPSPGAAASRAAHWLATAGLMVSASVCRAAAASHRHAVINRSPRHYVTSPRHVTTYSVMMVLYQPVKRSRLGRHASINKATIDSGERAVLLFAGLYAACFRHPASPSQRAH